MGKRTEKRRQAKRSRTKERARKRDRVKRGGISQAEALMLGAANAGRRVRVRGYLTGRKQGRKRS